MEDTEHESSKENMASPHPPCSTEPWQPSMAHHALHAATPIRSSFRTDTQGILVHLEVVCVSKIVGT